MSRFVNSETGVVVSVADDKDGRFASPLWEAQAEPKPAPKKATAKTAGK